MEEFKEAPPGAESERLSDWNAYVKAFVGLNPGGFEKIRFLSKVVDSADIPSNKPLFEKIKIFLSLYMKKDGSVPALKELLCEENPSLATLLPDQISSFPENAVTGRPELGLSQQEQQYADALSKLFDGQLAKLIFLLHVVPSNELPTQDTRRNLAEAFVKKFFAAGGSEQELRQEFVSVAPGLVEYLP